jgi:hypothetical protein
VWPPCGVLRELEPDERRFAAAGTLRAREVTPITADPPRSRSRGAASPCPEIGPRRHPCVRPWHDGALGIDVDTIPPCAASCDGLLTGERCPRARASRDAGRVAPLHLALDASNCPGRPCSGGGAAAGGTMLTSSGRFPRGQA